MEANSSSSLEHPWAIKHGFYGTMGGFAIDLENADDAQAQIFGNPSRLTLTAKSLSLLAKCGYTPSVSAEDTKDKNKTDSLAKGLVCLQAGWMDLQLISRQANKLPIAPLEVHTIAACRMRLADVHFLVA